ncbi:F-box protein At2g27310 [Lathyrus oleraceus]|uniref:F-box protein n=1 Tax=Pisum sativum TaxID=3888 RepID=A0A9D4X3Q2_PEA|nr:F-box protein At2g27310 [Pisum sativum]KAI5412500.1 hypothetical protein KIW84_057246 [Pisum sativum]
MDSSHSTNSPITTIHSDIIQSLILSRLDGTSLTSAASTASHLNRLCTEHHLWQKISTATWPSLNDPIAKSLISTFPSSHRSIFSDSFPSVDYSSSCASPSISTVSSSSLTRELISAVDLYYKGKPVFSKILRTDTHKGWFLCSPLWIEILEPNEVIQTSIKFEQNDVVEWLEENLTLSWIMIEPTRKRSVNLSSRLPVTVRRHWLTGELEVLYAVVMGLVQCTIKVTCCGKPGGEMHVREVSFSMEDMDGRHMVGRDSLVILQGAMEKGERKKVDVEESKKRFEKFYLMKRERRERRLRREKAMDMFIMLVAIVIFAFLFRFVRFWV